MSYEEERKIKLNEAYWGAADSGDFERFSAFFAEDSKMTFANDPPLSGKEVLRKFYAEFFQVIEKMKHKPIHSHSFPFGVVTELTVQYLAFIYYSKINYIFHSILLYSTLFYILYSIFYILYSILSILCFSSNFI
eukprot:TRINITY_DN2909_c0_g1_i2.p1 TRINITY_DN2909_c0_g1~~TRINITY_DN2909_c0_g1_i2.p1  ORF type:complete len:135 (-),score=27.78 TRINITY_DN2909_c0_g1_i2:207-611(-)